MISPTSRMPISIGIL
jgi:proline utilization trans-activator